MRRMNVLTTVFAVAGSLVLWGCQETEMMSYSNATKTLYKIDLTNCLETPIASLSSYGLTGVYSLTFSSRNAFCLADEDSLYCFDISNILYPAPPHVIAHSSCGNVYAGLTFCKGDTKLYGITESDLFEVDPNTCESIHKGNLGVYLGGRGLTCHPVSDSLYAFGGDSATLYIIDKGTGIAQSVGPLGMDILGGVGLEFDPLTRKLYGTLDENNDDTFSLYEINASTGAGTKVCDLPHGSRPNLGARVVPIAP